MTKKWMEVKGEIERGYLIQRRPLEEVRQQMLEEHGFAASTRAYKDKFKEWGWKTYKKACVQDSAYVKSRISRSRQCRKPLFVSTRHAGLKNMQEKIESQAIFLAQEENELRALHHSLEEEHDHFTTVEKVNESISRITHFEETICELRKCIEEIESRKNAPSGFAACWKQEPITLEDALGRLLLIPLDIVVSWESFEGHLESFFRACPGSKKVQNREYAIEDGVTRTAFSRSQPWSLFSAPGRKVEMSMIFKGRSKDSNKTSVVCPKCDTISHEKKGALIKCKNMECKMLFRTEDEEDKPAQQARPKPSGSGKSAISQFILPSGTEVEEEEEDKPSSFKRVIIRVAKLQQHIQTTAASNSELSQWTDPLLPPQDIFLPEQDISLQGWIDSSYELDFNSFDLDRDLWDMPLTGDPTTSSTNIAQPLQNLVYGDYATPRIGIRFKMWDGPDKMVRSETEPKYLTANEMWDRLQAQDDEFDIDIIGSLYTELQKKARVSANGAAIMDTAIETCYSNLMDQIPEQADEVGSTMVLNSQRCSNALHPRSQEAIWTRRRID
ncbi:hypothetical protein EG329_007352 [Mollisiaceae sp. DMI_Dod_QoI]|nr:hypothetical protein EG329_007352 [Helotiales sp. DMI_Dod_QoI]